MEKEITILPYTYNNVEYTNIVNIYNLKDLKDVVISGYIWNFNNESDKNNSSEHIENSTYNNSSDSLYANGFESDVSIQLYKTGKFHIKGDPKNGTLYKAYMESIQQEELVTDPEDATIEINKTTGEYKITIKKIRYPEKQLPYYKIKFTYNGVDYEASLANYSDSDLPETNKLKDTDVYVGRSKATENSKERNTLNDALSTISGVDIQEENWNNDGTINGVAYNSKGDATAELTYDYTDGEGDSSGISTLNNIEFTDSYTTNVTATFDLMTKDSDGNYVFSQSYVKDTTGETYGEVKRINLGLLTREMPDLSVRNEIENVVTTINGYNNLYKTTLSAGDPDGSDLKVGVTYVTDEKDENGDNKLSRFTVYPSDVKTWAGDTNSDDDSRKLRVYVTYKVTITNNALTIYNNVRKLSIYHDNNYELMYIGPELTNYNYRAYDTNGNYKWKEEDYELEGYSKVSVEVYGNLDPGMTKTLYMTYEVKSEEIKMMLANGTYVPQMKNIVEIDKYTTYSATINENGKRTFHEYAGIDKDSAPESINNNQKDEDGDYKIDDDTGKANEFKIVQEGTRTLTGTVFLDSTSEELKTGEKRQGDSIYDEENENKLRNVTVELIGQAGTGKNIIAGTDVSLDVNNYSATEEGVEGNNTYLISGFIPGDYIIKYTYGNGTYYEADGKQVNINAVDYKSAIVKDVEGETEVKTAFTDGKGDWYKLDNPQTEEEVNDTFTRYNEAVDDWTQRQKIDEEFATMTMDNTGADANIAYTIDAQTPTMNIAVELNTMSTENKFIQRNYNIINMDFGITERARQEMELNKEVSGVKITLANGQVILDAVKNADGKFENITNMKVVPGTIDIELDSELIHGATLEIEYAIKVKNNSELDYYTEKYYAYGEVGSGDGKYIVRLYPSTIVDYVDNNLVYDKKENGLTGWSITNLADANVDSSNVLYEDNNSGKEVTKGDIYTIVKTTFLNNPLNPGKESGEIKLKLSRLLSNTTDNMNYNNDAEITKITKTGGRRIITKLGTYKSENGGGIGDSSEEVIITPPTGLSESNATYYILIASGLLSIMAGVIAIVLIKRKK